MYSILLIVSMLVVVLSPLLLDLFLSVQELGSSRRTVGTKEESGPQIAWASPRVH